MKEDQNSHRAYRAFKKAEDRYGKLSKEAKIKRLEYELALEKSTKQYNETLAFLNRQ
jgi:hypothetical protein